MFVNKSSRVSYHVVESLGDAVISGVDQVDFGSLHGHRAAGHNLRRHLQRTGHHGFLIWKHSAAATTSTFRLQLKTGITK